MEERLRGGREKHSTYMYMYLHVHHKDGTCLKEVWLVLEAQDSWASVPSHLSSCTQVPPPKKIALCIHVHVCPPL